jgi:putative SOS response-associated peptidase YedK
MPEYRARRRRLSRKLFSAAGCQQDRAAGIWRPWTGDRGTKKTPNVGDHTLFSIMTTEPNAVVEPIHEQAMPVLLMTAEDVERWLNGSSVEDALAMQKPAAEEVLEAGPPVKPEKKAV